MVLESLNDDPYMVSGQVTFPASYDTMTITIRVSEGPNTIGQAFFLTDTDSNWSEDKSLVFSVVADGQFRDYTLDLSTARGWDGLIQRIRIDPVATGATTIDIDRVAFPG